MNPAEKSNKISALQKKKRDMWGKTERKSILFTDGKGDLIEVFNMFKKKINKTLSSTDTVFEIHRDPVTRNKGLKLEGERFQPHVRKYLFTNTHWKLK